MQSVELRVAGGIFEVRFRPTLTTAIMLLVLIGLGSWQVERLHWKNRLIDTIQSRLHSDPVAADRIGDTAIESLEYQPATVTGLFDYRHEFYLSAISLTGQGGYHVLTPLRLSDSTYLLVDRGWIPYTLKGSSNGFSRPQGEQSLSGILRLPHHGWAQPGNRPDRNEWYWPDLDLIAQTAGVTGLKPVIFDVSAASDSAEYPVGGQTRLELPNNHLQYVLTWYGLAVVLTIIYVIQGFRKITKV